MIFSGTVSACARYPLLCQTLLLMLCLLSLVTSQECFWNMIKHPVSCFIASGPGGQILAYSDSLGNPMSYLHLWSF